MTFISKVKQGAINGWHSHQILPSVSIAQAILESASGKSSLAAKYNNLFGIKASADWSGKVINLPTMEHGSGGAYQITAGFRWYDSWDDSMIDHAAFFTNTEWRRENYKNVVGETDYKKASQALRSAGYATDPNYATKLIKIIEDNNLTQYDTEAFNGKPSNAGTIKKTVGGTLTELAKSAIKQYNVTLIGDSLGVGTQPKLTSAFKSFTHDVLGSRQITHATNSLNGTYVLQSLKDYGQLKDIIVVVLGTNRGVTDAEVDNFVSIAGSNRKVIFVDTNSQVGHRQSVSDAYKRASERHNNVYFANWMSYSNSFRSRYYGSDNIHMTNEGYQAHTDFIKMAVYETGVGIKTVSSSSSSSTNTNYIGIEELEFEEDGLTSPLGESVIYNHSANELWGSKTGDKVIWVESILEVESDDPQFILNAGLKIMRDNGQPAAQYVVDLAELPDEVSIGDWGVIIDHEFNPPLYIHARVLEIITSETDLNGNKAVIGNVTELFPADKSDIKLIQSDLKDVRENLVRDYRKGQPILTTINSTNGMTLGDKYTETELVAKVTQGAEDLTNRFIKYSWERVSSNSVSDDAYNAIIATETTNRLTITSKDVINNLSTFVARVYDGDALINQTSITIKHIDTALWTEPEEPSDAKDGATWVDENGTQWVKKDGVWEERVDQEQLKGVRDEVEGAITEAEEAKQEAINSKNEAIAEAERLVTEQDTVWQGKMDDYDEQVAQIETDVQSAQSKADQALQEAGISTDLAQTAKDLSETAKANAQTALSNSSTAISNASQAVADALTAKDNAQTALDDAQTALTEAGSAKTTANNLTVRVDDVEDELELKASQSMVDGLSGTVSNHSTTLTQQANQIASKADSSLVNTIKGTVDTHTTEIAQNATAITSKASTSSVNTLTGRVNTAETTLTQHANRISARLTQAQVDDLVGSKGYSTVNYVDNQITTTANGIKTELTKVEGKIPVEFGGTNLIPDSDLIGHSRGIGTWTNTSLKPSSDGLEVISTAATGSFGIRTKSFDIVGGQDYIISADIGSYFSVPNLDYVHVMHEDGLGNTRLDVLTINASDTILRRYSLKFTAPRTGRVNILFGKTITAQGQGFRIRNIQLEKGAIASDWSPAVVDSVGQEVFNVFKTDFNSKAEGWDATSSYIGDNKVKLNTLVSNADGWSNTISYVDGNKTAFNETIAQVNSYKQTLGTDGGKIAQMVMTNSLFSTKVLEVVEVGGANLLPHTDFSIASNVDKAKAGATAGTTIYRDKPADNPNYFAYAGASNQSSGYVVGFEFGKATGDGFSMVQGQWYTVSFLALMSGAVVNPLDYVYIMRSNGANRNISDLVSRKQVGTAYSGIPVNKYTYTFQATATDSDAWVLISTRVKYLDQYQWIRVGQIQVEKGNVSTDWASADVDKATQSEVTQLSNSWALTLKSGDDIKTQINATTSALRLKADFIHLSGRSLIDNASIQSAHINSINANKVVGNTADFNTIRAGVLTANVVTSTHISADTALIDKLFATSALIDRLTSKTAFISQLKAIDLVADKASFLEAAWTALNSRVTIDGAKIRLANTAGDFAEMNNIPEFRSQDAAGTAAILGKGRSHYYSASMARFYIGTSLEGSATHGVHIAKGQSWGIYRNSDSYGGSPAEYYTVASGQGAVQVIEDLMVQGKVSSNFNTAAAQIRSLNGWPTSHWPVLQPGQQVLYKEAVPGNSSGVERIWTMGTSSGGSTRVYSHVHHVFEGGTAGTSDERLKHDIAPTLVTALDHIDALTFKEFKWNKDNLFEPLGLIAQHSGILRVQSGAGEMEGIDIQRAIMLALKGIQELQEEIKNLKESK